MKRRTVGLALLVSFAVGCGGDDKEAVSKADYVKQANGICAEFTKNVDAEGEKAFAGLKSENEITPAIYREFFEATLPLFEATVEDLKKLEPPEGDEEAVEKIYAAGEREAERVSAALDSKAGVKALAAKDDVTPQFEGLAGNYGLTTCAAD